MLIIANVFRALYLAKLCHILGGFICTIGTNEEQKLREVSGLPRATQQESHRARV